MDYGHHLANSLALTWRNKSWWPLALMLAVIPLLQLIVTRVGLIWLAGLTEFNEAEFMAALEQMWQPTWLIIGLLNLLVVGLGVWLVTAVAEGGLIWAVNERQDGRPAPFSAAFAKGWGFLIRLIAIDTAIFFPLFLILLVAMLLGSGGLIGSLLMLAEETTSLEGALWLLTGVGGIFLCLSALALPVGLLTFLFRFVAFRAAIVENLPAPASLRRAGRLFRQHWVPIIILGLILWVIRRAVHMVASFVLTPLQLIGLEFAFNPDRIGGPSLAAHLVGMIGDLGSFLLTAAILLFSAVAWTLFYRALLAQEQADLLAKEAAEFAPPEEPGKGKWVTL